MSELTVNIIFLISLKYIIHTVSQLKVLIILRVGPGGSGAKLSLLVYPFTGQILCTFLHVGWVLVVVKADEKKVKEIVTPQSGAFGSLDAVHFRKASLALSGAQRKNHP